MFDEAHACMISLAHAFCNWQRAVASPPLAVHSSSAAECLRSPRLLLLCRFSSLCDRWAVAFLLQLLALVIVGGICYNKWKGEFQTSDPGDTRDHSSDLGPLAHAFPLIAIAVAVAIAQAAVWLWLMQNHGRTLIWVTLIFGLIVSAAAVILAARAGNIVGACMAAIFFVLNLWSVTHAQAAVTSACSHQLLQ